MLLGFLPEMTAQTAGVDNGTVRREIDLSGGHITGKSYVLLAGNTGFIWKGSK